MIEIVRGTHEESVLKILLERYPISIRELCKDLPLSRETIERVLDAFVVKGVVSLDVLPGITYIRLMRRDFRFVGKRRQKRFVKHKTGPRDKGPEKYDGPMFS